ncbi:MAG TPA: YciI family protein [Gammaproteobacteria bacterium]|nr:YciI family protein [Gammaproteobacteria bacterium]
MRFLLTTKSLDAPTGPPNPKLIRALAKLGEEMTKAGVIVATGGMALSGPRVTLEDGEIGVTDGPFAEAKEVIGGFAIVEVASREEAIAHARRFLDIHREILGKSYRAENEVRRLYGPWDAPRPRHG